MKKHYKISTSLFIFITLSTQVSANATEHIHSQNLKELANSVKNLSAEELEELGTLVGVNHQHGSKKVVTITTDKENKIKEILTKLGGLAQKEGTDSACKFCSAILKDVTVNKVEVLDMAQDWIQIRIKKGNTLSHFAKNYYGKASAYPLIYEANKDTLGKDFKTYEGHVLTIPRVETLEKQNSKTPLSCKFCAALLSDASLKRIDVLKVNKKWIEVKIKKGDSLSHLAQKYYGKASQYKKIYEANKDIISETYLIHPGDIIKIPSL